MYFALVGYEIWESLALWARLGRLGLGKLGLAQVPQHTRVGGLARDGGSDNVC